MTNFTVKTGKSIYEEIKYNMDAIEECRLSKQHLSELPNALKVLDDSQKSHTRILNELKEMGYLDDNEKPYNGHNIYLKIERLTTEKEELEEAVQRLEERSSYKTQGVLNDRLYNVNQELNQLMRIKLTVRKW